MAFIFIGFAIIFAIFAYACYDKANKIDKGYNDTSYQSKTENVQKNQIQHNQVKTDYSTSVLRPPTHTDDVLIDKVERYRSWSEYKSKHPLRATEIKSLGIDLTSKSDEDASEWIFAIETIAHDSNWKISEIKEKYYDSLVKYNLRDADWIYLLPGLVSISKEEAEKRNVKIGNTAADVMLLFILDKITEIETKYVKNPPLTKSDPMTLTMRFALESDDDVLMLQKLHIYLYKYPLIEECKNYRDNWHTRIMSILEKRISVYKDLKGQPSAYNLAVSSEIYKLTHDEVPNEMKQGIIEEFNDHLLSFHEEMEIIAENASNKYMI